MSFATFLVRDLHASSSNIDCIRHVRKRMKPDIRKDPARREDRKVFYRQCLLAHQKNQALYTMIQKGQST